MVMGHTHPTPHIKMSDSAGVKKKKKKKCEKMSPRLTLALFSSTKY